MLVLDGRRVVVKVIICHVCRSLFRQIAFRFVIPKFEAAKTVLGGKYGVDEAEKDGDSSLLKVLKNVVSINSDFLFLKECGHIGGLFLASPH